jgi:hypothetical protein
LPRGAKARVESVRAQPIVLMNRPLRIAGITALHEFPRKRP